MGQKRQFIDVRVESVRPLTTDIRWTGRHVSFVPQRDIGRPEEAAPCGGRPSAIGLMWR